MANKILDIHDLKREFQMGVEIVKALKGVSFSVEDGEFITSMGSSGSGKTTMLNILGCLDKPTSGTYLLDNVDVKKLSRNELAQLRNRKIGFVFHIIYWQEHLLWKMWSCHYYTTAISTSQRHQMALKR
jgi:putative ABC transport system ATP-binding protein